MNFALLAPAIIGGAVGLIGLAALLWMNHNRPVLRLPAHETASEEDQRRLPFDERTSESQPEVRPSFERQFEDHRRY